jgi:HEAT repeat protein
VAALTDVSNDVRATAATTLKEVQDLRRIHPLLKSAQDAEPTVRLAAIAAMGQEPSPLVTTTLLNSLGDPDARVRLAAAQGLQQQADSAHMTPCYGKFCQAREAFSFSFLLSLKAVFVSFLVFVLP